MLDSLVIYSAWRNASVALVYLRARSEMRLAGVYSGFGPRALWMPDLTRFVLTHGRLLDYFGEQWLCVASGPVPVPVEALTARVLHFPPELVQDSFPAALPEPTRRRQLRAVPDAG